MSRYSNSWTLMSLLPFLTSMRSLIWSFPNTTFHSWLQKKTSLEANFQTEVQLTKAHQSRLNQFNEHNCRAPLNMKRFIPPFLKLHSSQQSRRKKQGKGWRWFQSFAKVTTSTQCGLVSGFGPYRALPQ